MDAGEIFNKIMGVVSSGIPVTPQQSKLAGGVGRALVYASEQTGADDDTPGILTFGEIANGLGAQLPGN